MQVEHAVADGYDVRGLMYWTLMDNFEVRPRITWESPPCSELLEALDSDVLLCLKPERHQGRACLTLLLPNPCMCAM